MRIITGYGLEGALPDATCKEIVDQTMLPALKLGKYDAALTGGVADILSATKGEYKGTGRTTNDLSSDVGLLTCIGSAVGVFALFGILLLILHNFGGTFYQNHNRSLGFFENAYMFVLSMALNVIFSGGSGSSGGGSSGGFSGGGGSFGGGGAGGKW